MGNTHKISLGTLLSTTLLCLLAGHYAIVHCLLAYCSISSFKNVTPIVLQKSVNCVALLNTWLIKVCWNVMLGASIMNMKIGFKFNLWLFWTQIMTRKIAMPLDFGCCNATTIHGPFNSNCHLCICLHSFTWFSNNSFLCNKIHIGTWYPLHKIKVSCFSELIVVSLLASLLCLLVDCCITSCPSLSYFWHSFHNWHFYRQDISVTLGLMLMIVLKFSCKFLKTMPQLLC